MEQHASIINERPLAETTREPVIEIRNLSKSFNGKDVLRDINLDLYRGENVVVLGKSGQGKSVTIKCIVGLLQQDSGTLKVFGKEIADMEEQELKDVRTRIGFLFQGAALYDSMTVRQNLEFPLRRIKRIHQKAKLDKAVAEILDSVSLPDVADKMPSELSGGMRKRIGLARTMVMKPEVILYDEPTTGLDTITSREISELIVRMQHQFGISSIIITHDMACARKTANRVVIMDGGTLVANGIYSELAASDNELVHSFFI